MECIELLLCPRWQMLPQRPCGNAVSGHHSHCGLLVHAWKTYPEVCMCSCMGALSAEASQTCYAVAHTGASVYSKFVPRGGTLSSGVTPRNSCQNTWFEVWRMQKRAAHLPNNKLEQTKDADFGRLDAIAGLSVWLHCWWKLRSLYIQVQPILACRWQGSARRSLGKGDRGPPSLGNEGTPASH